MTAGPLGVAVVGAGSWGALLLRAMAAMPAFEIRGVVRRPNEGGDRNRTDRVDTYVDLDEALADDGVAVVVVASPNDLHATTSIRAMEAGRHVFVEKPMALRVADADLMVGTATANQVVLMVDHLMRYYEPLAYLHGLVVGGAIGETVSATITRRDRLRRVKPWLQQRNRVGGLLFQSGTHELDLLRWLCGDVAEIVSASATTRIAAEPLDYPDMIVSQLRFVSGAVGQVWSCMSDPAMVYGGVVAGTKGSIGFDLYRASVCLTTFDAAPVERHWHPSDGWSPNAWVRDGGIAAGEVEALRLALTDFAQAIDTGRDQVNARDGVAATELAQAGYLSLAEQRPVVLPLPPDQRMRLPQLDVPVPDDPT